MPVKRITVKRYECTCTRCKAVWITREDKIPERCNSCNSPYWDREKVLVRKEKGK